MKYKDQLQKKYPSFDFTKFTVTNGSQKSIIVCPVHGEFQNSYKELIRQKYGCRYCKPRVESYIVTTCPTHGEYTYKRYSSPNCKRCLQLNIRGTHEEFIKKLGVKNYTVVSIYEKSDKKITVQDKYGKLTVTPNHLLRGKTPTINSALDKTKYCINQFREVHGDFFNYSEVDYQGNHKNVVIICPIHGRFLQTPASHKKHTCKKCAYEKLDIGFDINDFIRVSSGRVCRLYLVEIEHNGDLFLKVGITSRQLSTRLSGLKYKVVALREDRDASYIYNTERLLHRRLKRFSYKPMTKFNGHTECYNITYLKDIVYEFRRV